MTSTSQIPSTQDSPQSADISSKLVATSSGDLFSKAKSAAPWIVFLAFYGLYPIIFNSPNNHSWGVLMVMYALYATGWNMLGGMAGQISLGHATFFGIGAYAMAVGARNDFNPWLSMIVGALLAVPVALLVGWPVFRLKGHYFTIATIGVSEIVYIVALNQEWLGAASGLKIPSQDNGIANMQWVSRSGQKWEYYYMGLVLVVIALVTTALIARSRMGYYLQAIRNNQEAASALGVQVTRYKQMAFAYSAVVVSVAGSFFAQNVLFVDPESIFNLNVSIKITIVAVLGGVMNRWGPIIGAVVYMLLTEWIRINFGGNALDLVISGGIIMVLAAFEPRGLIGLADRARSVVDLVRGPKEAKHL